MINGVASPSVASTDPNPFDEFETLAEVFAFTFHKCREAGLRELLASGSYRENLEEAAAELKAAGLRKAAQIVAEIAANSPPEASRCPYEEGSYNAKCWHRRLEQRQRQRKLKQQ